MNHIGRIALRGEREATARGFNPRLEAVDERDAACGRRGGGEQQRVIAARANSACGAAGKAAVASGFEPFLGQG